MNDNPDPQATQTDPHVNQAILENLQAEDAGAPLDADDWLARSPAHLRPTLQDFLERHVAPTKSGPRSRQRAPIVDFDKYTDFQLLASGGMGSIYRCTDNELHRPVAMKIMHPHLAGQQ